MSAELMVKEALDEIPQAVAGGVVDMESGMMLVIKTVDTHPREVIEILGPATKELFEGDMVRQIEDLFRRARGEAGRERTHYFQEILISSGHLWHYFGRLKSDPRIVLAVVAKSDVNLGLFLVKARRIREGGTI